MTTSALPAAEELVAALAQQLMSSGWRMVTVESCTGGAIGELITARAGSSDWYEGGWITYSNALKQQLGVPSETITAHGAVSEPVALAMAEQGRQRAGADVAVAVTGVAGPGGGSADKPVGTVWIGWVWPGGREARLFQFEGDRARVRSQATLQALQGLKQRV